MQPVNVQQSGNKVPMEKMKKKWLVHWIVKKHKKNSGKLPLKQLKREDVCILAFTLHSPELLLALFAWSCGSQWLRVACCCCWCYRRPWEWQWPIARLADVHAICVTSWWTVWAWTTTVPNHLLLNGLCIENGTSRPPIIVNKRTILQFVRWKKKKMDAKKSVKGIWLKKLLLDKNDFLSQKWTTRDLTALKLHVQAWHKWHFQNVSTNVFSNLLHNRFEEISPSWF